MSRLVLTSFTPASASGGVPRWNRDFLATFPQPGRAVHYSWPDVVKSVGRDYDLPEWEKAKFLAKWLLQTKKVTLDDIVIGDGFWADGYHPSQTISVSHGNWSHTTADDVAAGILPEFPQHHAAQLEFRKRHQASGGRLVAVSDFIADQCKIQWDIEQPVINNGIDLAKFVPPSWRAPRNRPVIVHGVTNANKGYEHIALLKRELDADVLQLDELARFFSMPKYRAMAQADLAVIPSAHEGNSYFLLECLASNVPIVAYAVGLPFIHRRYDAMGPAGLVTVIPYPPHPGLIMNRKHRSPETTFVTVQQFFKTERREFLPREWVSQFSLERFQQNWRDYLKTEFGFEP